MVSPTLRARCVACFSAAMVCAVPAAAQQPQVQAAVIPEAITVGDVFHAAVRVPADGPRSVQAPDSLPLPPDLESAGPPQIRFDSAGGTATVVYPLTAWRPGSYTVPPVPLLLTRAGSVTRLSAQLPPFEVTSVLPADTAGIEPKPARGVIGPNRLWWPLLLAALLLLVAGAALWFWWRRRRPAAEAVPIAPRLPPHERALAELAALRAEGLTHRGEFKPYYQRLTATLREYASAVDPAWSMDLTTAELATRVAHRAEVPGTWAVVPILRDADLVKFARAQPGAASADAHLDEAVRWVELLAGRPRGVHRSAA